MSPPDVVDWIALNLLPGLGPITTRRALERFGNPAAVAFGVDPEELQGVPGFRRRAVPEIRAARRDLRRRAERELERCRRHGIVVRTPTDEEYPAALRELPDSPPLLYVRGRVRPGVLRVAIVGSRNPTAYGQRLALGLSAGLADREIEVVSGGARGIDALAHTGALEDGGSTLAVLGSGLLRPYPPENETLFERIAECGALVSEFPLETPPSRDSFPRRNRLISGLSAAVVVVEAAARSGSLLTANHALEQGREVLAVPGPVTSARSVGCHRLIQQGAKLVQRIEDILDELPPVFRSAASPATPSVDPEAASGVPESLDGDDRRVYEILDEVEPIQVDELAARLPLPVARLQAALFGLEIRGLVECLPGRFYLRLGGGASGSTGLK